MRKIDSISRRCRCDRPWFVELASFEEELSGESGKGDCMGCRRAAERLDEGVCDVMVVLQFAVALISDFGFWAVGSDFNDSRSFEIT